MLVAPFRSLLRIRWQPVHRRRSLVSTVTSFHFFLGSFSSSLESFFGSNSISVKISEKEKKKKERKKRKEREEKKKKKKENLPSFIFFLIFI